MNKITFLLLGILSLTGCASTEGRYTGPNAANVGGSFHREGLTTWNKVELISIDNKSAPYGFFQSGVDAKVPVAPGSHSFVARVTVSRGLTSGEFDGLVDVRANVQGGRSYQLKGGMNGARMDAWLEDAAGRKVSGVTSGPAQNAPVNNVSFVPVVVSR